MRATIMLLLALWVATPATAQVLFESDFSTTSPYGFSANWGDFTYYTNTPSPDGGPGNRPWVRQAHIVTGTTAQYYHGWEVTGLPAVTQGASRFYRWRMRVDSGFNALGNGDVWGTKFIIIGDGIVSDGDRIMVLASPRTGNTDFTLRLSKNISSDFTPDVELTKGTTWVSIQMEVDTSTTTGTADAVYKFWMNSDAYGSPTSSYSGFTQTSAGMTQFRFGFYAGATLATGGQAIMDFAEIEVADSFDASWHANSGSGGGGGATGPTRLRIRGEN